MMIVTDAAFPAMGGPSPLLLALQFYVLLGDVASDDEPSGLLTSNGLACYYFVIPTYIYFLFWTLPINQFISNCIVLSIFCDA